MKNRKLLYVSLCILVLFLVLFVRTVSEGRKSVQTLSDSLDNRVVIIDAGHGGIDGGAVATDGTVEKDINLSIAKKLNLLLQINGIKTVMTRDSDVSIHDSTANTVRQKKVSDIHNRLNIMKNTESSVFVSIHQNHFTGPKSKGTQVFYSGNNPESEALARTIQQSVVQAIQTDNTRAVKKSGTEIYLLYHAVRPAVMVECGFLSNPEETRLLKTQEYQMTMAMAIYKGIITYFTSTEAV